MSGKNRFHAEVGHRKSALNPVWSATGVQGGSLCRPGIRRGASMAFPACCCQRHILADASANTCLPSPPLEITVARLCPGCFRFEGTAGVRMQDRSAEKNFFRLLPSPRCRRINRCRHQTAGCRHIERKDKEETIMMKTMELSEQQMTGVQGRRRSDSRAPRWRHRLPG